MGAPISAGAVRAGVVVGIGVCVVAAVVGMLIQANTTTPCECFCLSGESERACLGDTPDRCKEINPYMKVPLIATHLIPFILMPVSMWVCESGAAALQQMGMKSPSQVVLGLAYIMVSISGEVGWHVHQRWFYHEDYDILNFFFYAFNTLGASFWALGAAPTEATTSSGLLDAVLMLCTPLTAVVYALGAYAAFNNLSWATKVPIYIIMTYQYGLLSWRLFTLLNNDFKVWLFPFFSVGVNLFFVFLLSTFETNLVLNPLFHILHDAAGTEMGVLVITIILWRATSNADYKKSS